MTGQNTQISSQKDLPFSFSRRQFPQEKIQDKVEKSTNWLKLYKNVVNMELTNPRTMKIVNYENAHFRQEITIPGQA